MSRRRASGRNSQGREGGTHDCNRWYNHRGCAHSRAVAGCLEVAAHLHALARAQGPRSARRAARRARGAGGRLGLLALRDVGDVRELRPAGRAQGWRGRQRHSRVRRLRRQRGHLGPHRAVAELRRQRVRHQAGHQHGADAARGASSAGRQCPAAGEHASSDGSRSGSRLITDSAALSEP